MGLFDRKSKNQINDLIERGYRYGSAWFTPLDRWDLRKYSDEYLWLILETIFAGMRNVRFYSDVDDRKLERIVAFLDTNFIPMIWEMWHTGAIVVGIGDKGKPYMVDWSDVRKGRDGRITNYDVVYYSDKYQLERKTDFGIIAEALHAIDVYKNGDIHLTENFGALGILTGKGLPTSPADKDEFNAELKKSYGIEKDKKQILLTTMPLDFKQFTLPVKQLELPEKIEQEVKTLCRYFNVPPDLIIGGSTFDNQAQATVNFYRNCISPLAEIALKVGQYILRKHTRLFVPTDKLTFRIDNVAELEDDRTAEVEYKTKLVDLIAKMRDLELDTTEYEKQLTNILS